MGHAALRIVAPDQREHGEAIFTLLNRENPGFGDAARESVILGSHYDWKTARIGLIDRVVVSHFGVYDIAMRIGTAWARTAGVNHLVTHPDYRGRGLMAQTCRAAIEAMRANGYDLSLICNGIEDYYARFGYSFAWPEMFFVIETGRLPAELPDVELQPCAHEQRADFATIYNRENEAVTGTAVRPTFPRGKYPGNGQGYFWTGGSGAVEGYMLFDIQESTNTLWHDDSAGDVEQRLRALGMLARRLGCARVRFERLSLRSPMGRRLRQMTCLVEAEYRRNGGWLARTINARTLFEKLVPELERRLRRSHLLGWRGDLVIVGQDQRIMLHIDQGRVRIFQIVGEDNQIELDIDARRVRSALPGGAPHVLHAGAALAQLAIGAEAPDELAETGQVSLSGDAGLLLPILFPSQHPQMSNDDL